MPYLKVPKQSPSTPAASKFKYTCKQTALFKATNLKKLLATAIPPSLYVGYVRVGGQPATDFDICVCFSRVSDTNAPTLRATDFVICVCFA